MMKYVETVGKTKEEAVEAALKQLGTTIDNVTIQTDEQKSGGFFGFLAKTEYRVKVTLINEVSKKDNTIAKTEPIQETPKAVEKEIVKESVKLDSSELEKRAKTFIEEIFESIGISNVEINTSVEDDNIVVKIFGDEASRLIGRRGDSLDSLQMLTNLAVNKGETEYSRVLLDIENYRSKREESLKKYANKMARQATKQRRILKLEPMNPYERRIVHSSLKDDRYVKTYSEGKDPYRRVVIEPKYRH
ncbi:MAG: RNA-binding cell elongation regulator Jag/EloR [Peptostreptococcaceae bacterium]|nr:RNA-binding cell elongation regulator Jag/EloR [Peptostreptococcaceae bacterium]